MAALSEYFLNNIIGIKNYISMIYAYRRNSTYSKLLSYEFKILINEDIYFCNFSISLIIESISKLSSLMLYQCTIKEFQK